MFKALLVEDEDIDRRGLVLAQHSFYTGARAVLKIQAFLLARGRYDELHAMIEKHGRQIDNLIKPAAAAFAALTRKRRPIGRRRLMHFVIGQLP
jgi:hypothetical protein